MTPKQKAAQLRYLFSKELDLRSTDKKVINCALVAVEEVRFFHERLFYATEGSLFDDYLNKVKHEIEKL